MADTKSSTPERQKANLYAAINTAFRIYAPARSWCRWTYESIEENPYQPKVAAKVIGLAFLSVVAAWEEFIEETFLKYMVGRTNWLQPIADKAGSG